MPLFEIVPNLSEGRDAATIDAAVEAAQAAGAQVLHRSSDPVHHRSVLTIAGNGTQVLDAAVAIAGVAVRHIDLRRHKGVHPRIGALDVLPFVPLRRATLAEAAELAHAAGERIWERYRVPSFFYGAAARKPQNALLADVRAGEFEGLDLRFERLPPDVGVIPKHESAGAIAVGARGLLVAFNIELATGDPSIAKEIARALRERSGGLCTLRALGLRLSEGVVQVSLNVTDAEATPLYRIVELVARLAAKNGVAIRRSELIGLIPRAAVEASARYYLGAL
ncbi:MAG TPA: glutamate formimidoyltransferase [Candidatus Acidoferrales bacterium]|nr:glutamate formimidoyltransferase [Candidatus Acidoferrales bacterium]